MNPRYRALIFILVATAVNLLITILYFIAFLLGTVYFLRNSLEQYGSSFLLLPLLASIIASFFSYRALIKYLDRKWQIKQYLGHR